MLSPTGVGAGIGGPFQLKQRVYALQQGTPRRATILEIGNAADGSAQYYVRFLDQDSRMDAWYSASELRPCEVKAPRIPSVAVTPTITTRGMANRLATMQQQEGGGGSNSSAATIIVSDEPPKRQPVSQDIATKRQRKDSRKKKSGFLHSSHNYPAILHLRTMKRGMVTRAGPQAPIYLCTSPVLVSDLGAEATLELRQISSDSSHHNSVNLRPTALTPTGRLTATAPFVLHLCPCCLEPFSCNNSVIRHLQYVCLRHPPGVEVYRDPDHDIILFELDGKAEPDFANNLALLSKLFLEHKALDCDMTPFNFYVLCQVTSFGCEVLGYFSKEKISPDNFNLSCILTLPQYQGRGIGRFLVEISYEITRREGKVGSPEKPLSDLGEVTYLSYWKDTVLDYLAASADKGSGVSIAGIIASTCMTQQDVMMTLQKLNILSGGGGKQARKFSLSLTSEHVRQHEERKARRLANRSNNYIFDPALLCWHPSWYENRTELSPRSAAGVFTVAE
ncbi:histone acetyltransferase, putative [Bodo saltans]|uniref:Histone acetyltransferase n=1 Tax=Bodo saltans TaxID=75058 RepID=A0A0S4IZ19_BODSA|nr:histone acetyltransferase, putative [Bodo saltans]|eukprot:CUF84619.1 histone acetyltransferase, putative [Bodo saltans]